MGMTVKVSNVSLKASEKDVYEFFSFSGNIVSSEFKLAEDGETNIAYLTFQDERAVETAMLLSGAVIADKAIFVEPATDYLPDESAKTFSLLSTPSMKKAENVMATLLAKGYILGKDALAQAQAYDEKHELSRTAQEKVQSLRESAYGTAATLDQKYAISQKFNQTTENVTKSILAVDEQYNVSTKTREAFTVAESKINEAGQYLMENKYVEKSKSWLFGAVGKMSVFVSEISKNAQDKVHKAEEDKMMGRSSSASLIAGDDEETPALKPAPVVGLDDHGPPIAPAATPSTTPAIAPPIAAVTCTPAPVEDKSKVAPSKEEPPLFF